MTAIASSFILMISTLSMFIDELDLVITSDSGERSLDTNELTQLINTARKQGSLTIADRIDNADYLSAAIECGADFVSGYLVHPPQEDISSENEVVI